MTPRTEISWVDCERSRDEVREQLLDTPHSLFPVCRYELDEFIGVVRAKDLLVALDQGVDIAEFAARTPPIVVPETMDVIKLLAVLRRAKGRLVMVTNEFGVVQGLVTPLDVLEAIAGEFPDEDETPDIIEDGDRWLVKGGADLHSLEQALDCDDLVSPPRITPRWRASCSHILARCQRWATWSNSTTCVLKSLRSGLSHRTGQHHQGETAARARRVMPLT